MSFPDILPALVSKDKPLRDASAASVQPVRHTVKIEAGQ